MAARPVAVAACVLVSLAGCGSATRNRVETAPTTIQSTSTSTPDSPQSWCVRVSKQAALLAFDRWVLESSQPPPDASGDSLSGSFGHLDIKLISWSEWTGAPDPDHAQPSRWWLIEAYGGGLPARFAGKPVTWLLAWVNARTGMVRSESQGVGTPPSRWRTVMDHSGLCQSRQPTLGRPWGDAPQNQQGYGEIRPRRIDKGGDPTGIVNNVRWKSWGDDQAVGSGISTYQAPNQSAADGTQEQATVVAFNLESCRGVWAYSAIEWYFPQHGDKFDPNNYINICTGQYVGSP